MGNDTTITILDARLRLVHVPRSRLQALMSPIIDCWWFRKAEDPFFALSVNGLEVSIFADSETVERSFGPYMHEEAEEAEQLRARAAELDEANAGGSAITLGAGEHVPAMRTEQTVEREESVKVGEDEWVALEISFHGDGWEKAGQRVRDISSPLADEGISILFLSTYISDYLLLKADRLNDVTSILERSGFLFTANDDDGDDLDSPTSPSLSRSSTFSSHAAGGHGHHKNSASGGGSLAGSLVLSDRGSMSSASASSQRGATLSRSGSLRSATGAPSRPTPSASGVRSGSFGEEDRISPLSPSTLITPLSPSNTSASTAPLSPPTSTPTSPDPGPNTALPLPLPPAVSAFTPGESLTILPDELVCVGLSLTHSELWKQKLVQAIFYPERVLPPTRRQLALQSQNASSTMASSFLSTNSTSSSSSSSSGHSRTPLPPSLLTPRGPLSPSLQQQQHSPASFAQRNLSATLPTAQSDAPVPFISITQTIEGTSLTADLRLLRAVFKPEEEADMVNGGLRGIWEGEEGVGEGASERSRSRERSGGESAEGEGDGEEEWQEVEREDLERGRRERREMARQAGEGGRILLKCICLDLWAYGLDKTGIVEHLAGLLIEQDINLVYTSTFQSANILVAKSDITRARQILEESSQVVPT
ncbi:hypothetical protein RQP46_007103 [Phenoliferia psychrophenolica]